MARKKRIWYPDAIYHIYCRGNHRNDIYKDEYDYLHFLMIIKEVQQKIPFDLHCYCLMPNHYHMIIGTRDVPIGYIMQRINLLYTGYYNYKYQTDGHVFKGRYNSRIIEDNAYFLEVGRYVHLNPVKAGLADWPQDYPWSSYEIYTSRAKEEQSTVTTQRTLALLGGTGRLGYRLYVELWCMREKSTQRSGES